MKQWGNKQEISVLQSIQLTQSQKNINELAHYYNP